MKKLAPRLTYLFQKATENKSADLFNPPGAVFKALVKNNSLPPPNYLPTCEFALYATAEARVARS